MIDHRIPHDFNYSINSSSFTNVFMRAKMHKLKGDLIHHFGLYYTLTIIVKIIELIGCWNNNSISRCLY